MGDHNLRIAAGSWVVALLLFAGCSSDSEVADLGVAMSEGGALPTEGDTFALPDLPVTGELPAIDAQLAEVDLPLGAAWLHREVAAGDPVVVAFFASWCESCKRNLPVLERASSTGARVVGVNHLDTRPAAEQVVDERDITFPTLYDRDGDLLPELGGLGLPYTVALDHEGRVSGRVLGPLTAASLDQLLSDALAGAHPS